MPTLTIGTQSNKSPLGNILPINGDLAQADDQLLRAIFHPKNQKPIPVPKAPRPIKELLRYKPMLVPLFVSLKVKNKNKTEFLISGLLERHEP